MRLLLCCLGVALATADQVDRRSAKAISDARLESFAKSVLETDPAKDPDTATAAAVAVAEGTSTCSPHNLCSKCLNDPDCVWCADGKGSCVAGNSKGPLESTQCKAWESSYCRLEPCGVYTSCATCVADPFCGFAGGKGGEADNVCVEGHKEGPLTGAVLGQWFYLPNSCPARELPEGVRKEMVPALFGGATGVAGIDAAAGDALKQVEAAAGNMAGEIEKVRKDEGKMLGKEKQAFDIMKHLRIILDQWKKRSVKVSEHREKDRVRYQAMWQALKKKRENALAWLRTGIDQLYESEVADQNLMQKKKEQENLFQGATDGEDKKVGSESGGEQPKLDHMTSLMEDKAMKALEGWLGNMSHADRHIMKKLARSAGNEVEKELHFAGARRIAREEAGWYACAYILANPDDNLCQDFNEKFAGTQKARELTEEEYTRVCNMVKSQLDRSSTMPIFKGNTAGRKNIQLAWCVNNVKID